MNNSQTQTGPPAKKRGYRFWLGWLVFLVGMLFLMYYGYCWGFWGRSSLLLQYLFQCSCPPASEEARYPRRLDVLVSACQNITSSRLSPGGRLLAVYEETSGIASTYLLDLQTREKSLFTHSNTGFYFLNDNLLYIPPSYSEVGDILDRATEKQYPIRKFAYWRSDAYINGEANLSVLAAALLEAENIFLLQDSETLVALMQDFHIHPEHNFFLRQSAFPGSASDRMEQFLRDKNIAYQIIPADFPDEALSPDGRMVARADGIYLVETGMKIIDGYSASLFYRPRSRKYFAVRGWTYDGSGVIYSKFLNPCLIETNFFFGDDAGCFYEVPQPVIILKVPEEYQFPVETP